MFGVPSRRTRARVRTRRAALRRGSARCTRAYREADARDEDDDDDERIDPLAANESDRPPRRQEQQQRVAQLPQHARRARESARSPSARSDRSAAGAPPPALHGSPCAPGRADRSSVVEPDVQ